jgi:tetratricopeptide (TPR) repeat protein
LQEAAAEIKRGVELDPLSPWPRSSEPYILYLLGQKSEAVQKAREVIELFPWYWFGYFMCAAVMTGCGLLGEAVAAIEKGLTINPENALLLAVRAVIHGRSGEPGEARRILQRIEEMARTRYISPAALSLASAACGEFDRSYDWLDKGVDERDIGTAMIATRPIIPGYQNDPRYLVLLRKMNMEPPALEAEQMGSSQVGHAP